MASDEGTAYSYYLRLLTQIRENSNQRNQSVGSDSTLGDSARDINMKLQQGRVNRGELYTELCETFVSRWKIRSILIEIYKALFLIFLGYVCYLSGKELFRIVQQILAYSNRSGISHEALELKTDSVIAIVTAFVSFTSAIIALPACIGNYLFNKEENNDAVVIIKEMTRMDMGNESNVSDD